jgi:hypothetical protein
LIVACKLSMEEKQIMLLLAKREAYRHRWILHYSTYLRHA